MNTLATLSSTRSERGLRGTWNRLTELVSRMISDSLLALAARFAIAGIFFQSGRTKVDGWLTLTDSAYALFREEYKVPLVAPEIAAHLAAYAEHLFPLLLALGLCTRLSALARARGIAVELGQHALRHDTLERDPARDGAGLRCVHAFRICGRGLDRRGRAPAATSDEQGHREVHQKEP